MLPAYLFQNSGTNVQVFCCIVYRLVEMLGDLRRRVVRTHEERKGLKYILFLFAFSPLLEFARHCLTTSV